MNPNIWDIIGNISTAVASLVVSVSAILALLQIREMKMARTVEALAKVLDELLNPEVCRARRYIFTQKLPPPEEVPLDVYESMYQVWVSFDKVGLMVAFGLIPERLVLEMFYTTIIRSWQILEPYIKREREIRKARYQEFFQDLYHRSVAFRNKYYPQDVVVFHERPWK